MGEKVTGKEFPTNLMGLRRIEDPGAGSIVVDDSVYYVYVNGSRSVGPDAPEDGEIQGIRIWIPNFTQGGVKWH